MSQRLTRLTIQTPGPGPVEFTGDVTDWLHSIGAGDGLLTLFIRHTSASLIIQENADPAVCRDLEAAFQRLAPRDPALYEHGAEGPDDMPAHIRAALTQTHLSIPVAGGKMELGTWQGIYVFEHRDRPFRRTVSAHFSGECSR